MRRKGACRWGSMNGNSSSRVGLSRLFLYIQLETWDRNEKSIQISAAPRGREGGKEVLKRNENE